MEDIHQLITDAENRRPLVLIVDDISKNIQLLSTILSRKNYQIAFANSGEKALEFLEKRTPELILLDIMMPGMFSPTATMRLSPLSRECSRRNSVGYT